MTSEPSEIDALRTALAAAEARAVAAEAKAAGAARDRAVLANAEAMIAAPQARDREAAAGAVRDAVRAQGPAARAAGAAARGTRGHGDRGRSRRRASRRRSQPTPPGCDGARCASRSGASAARARGRPGADLLRGLRLGADRQARRGHHRDARGDPATLEGGPDRAREVHLPGLRADQPAAGAVPSRPRGAGPGRTCWRRSSSRSSASTSR